MTDRRAFLKLLAKGAAYAAPVVATYGVPTSASAQGQSSQHKHGHAAPAPSATDPVGVPAPGVPPTNPPPGGGPGS